MDRYLPTKDLPQDLKNLPREETVCKFCGVSYLIHHEMKGLENTIADLRSELQRKADLENEKIHWDEEKDKLEHSIKSLEVDLANAQSMKSDLDKEKAVWFQERQQLLLSVKSLEGDATAISTRHKAELQTAKEALFLKGNELSQLSLKAREREYQFSQKLTAASLLLKEAISLREAVKGDVTNMRTYFLACVGEIMRACSERDTKVRIWVRSRLCGLQGELTAERDRYSKECKDWANATDVLQQEAGHRERQNQRLANELLAMQEAKKVCSSELLRCQATCTAMKEKIRYLEEELSRLHSTEALSASRQQAAIAKLEGKLSTKEKALVDMRGELTSLKDSSFKEAEARANMQRLLEEAKEQASSVSLQLKQLSISNEQRIQKIHASHNEELRTMKDSCEKQNKTNLEKLLTQSKTEEELFRRKISELQETVDKQHIIIQQSRDDIRREKAVFDAEVTRHLLEVKDLELRLRDMQDSAQATQQSEAHSLKAVEKHLKTKVKLCTELEAKLRGCYEEISHLQTTVQRQCEERCFLEKDLEESRTALKKHCNQGKR